MGNTDAEVVLYTSCKHRVHPSQSNCKQKAKKELKRLASVTQQESSKRCPIALTIMLDTYNIRAVQSCSRVLTTEVAANVTEGLNFFDFVWHLSSYVHSFGSTELIIIFYPSKVTCNDLWSNEKQASVHPHFNTFRHLGQWQSCVTQIILVIEVI